jgi:hypothetical protein
MLKQWMAIGLVAIVAGCASTPGSSSNDPAAVVAATAERLRLAMIDPTRDNLDPLIADELSYGHSGGKVDTKASFSSDLLDGKSDFVTIVISDQSIKLIGSDLAIVRHTLAADTNDSGKPGKVLLKVLGVWQKQGGQWKLLARQAVRPS